MTGQFAFLCGCDVRVAGSGYLALGNGYCADGVHNHCNHSIPFQQVVGVARYIVIIDNDQHELDGDVAVAVVTIGDGGVITDGVIVPWEVSPGWLLSRRRECFVQLTGDGGPQSGRLPHHNWTTDSFGWQTRFHG